MIRSFKSLALAFALALAAACGGTDVGSGTFSCDVVSGSSHGCVDYSWNGGVYPTTSWNQACTQNGGTAGSGCSHTGAIGGCKLVTTSGTITVNTTTWFYSGTTTNIQTACSAEGATFVAP